MKLYIVKWQDNKGNEIIAVDKVIESNNFNYVIENFKTDIENIGLASVGRILAFTHLPFAEKAVKEFKKNYVQPEIKVWIDEVNI